MNQNIEPNQQPQQKSDAVKITLIITLSVGGIILLGIIGFFLFMFTAFNRAIDTIEESKEEIYEKWEEEDTTSEDEEEEPVQPTYEYIDSISYERFNEMIDNGESFVILISQRDCGHCAVFKPYYNQAMQDNNIKGYDLDIQMLNQTDRSDFLTRFNVSSTPTTMIFTNGVAEEETLVGVYPPEDITNFLKKYNLIQ